MAEETGSSFHPILALEKKLARGREQMEKAQE